MSLLSFILDKKIFLNPHNLQFLLILLSVHKYCEACKRPLLTMMYTQHKLWELEDWIPDVHECKLKKWSQCPCSCSSIAKHLPLQCWNRVWLAAHVPGPKESFCGCLCGSSCSLHPSCHLVTPSLKELTNASHLMSHLAGSYCCLGHS